MVSNHQNSNKVIKMPPAKIINRYIEERKGLSNGVVSSSNGSTKAVMNPAGSRDDSSDVIPAAQPRTSRFARPWESPYSSKKEAAASIARRSSSSPIKKVRTPSPIKAPLSNVKVVDPVSDVGTVQMTGTLVKCSSEYPSPRKVSPRKNQDAIAANGFLESHDDDDDEEDRPLKAKNKDASKTRKGSLSASPVAVVVKGRKSAPKSLAATNVKRRSFDADDDNKDKDFKIRIKTKGIPINDKNGGGGIGVRTRRSAGKAELERNLSISKEWWSCALCKASCYYGSRASKDHFITIHGFDLQDDQVLDSQERLFEHCLQQGTISPNCILCDDFTTFSHAKMLEHYVEHHKVTQPLLVEQLDKVTGEVEYTRRDVQPPSELETLVSLAYEEMFGSEALYINAEACSFIAEEYVANGLHWMTEENDIDDKFPLSTGLIDKLRVIVSEEQMHIFNHNDDVFDEEDFDGDFDCYYDETRPARQSSRIWSFDMPEVIRFNLPSGSPAPPGSPSDSTDSRDRNENLKEVRTEKEYLQTVESFPDSRRYRKLGFMVENLPKIDWLREERDIPFKLWMCFKHKAKISLFDFYSYPLELSQLWLDQLVKLK